MAKKKVDHLTVMEQVAETSSTSDSTLLHQHYRDMQHLNLKDFSILLNRLQVARESRLTSAENVKLKEQNKGLKDQIKALTEGSPLTSEQPCPHCGFKPSEDPGPENEQLHERIEEYRRRKGA